MSKLDVLAAVLAAPTVLTGIALLFVKREQSDRWIDLAIGVSAIAAFFLRGTDRGALSAFKRMRLGRS